MYSVINGNGQTDLELHSIHERLEEIRSYLQKEILFKQSIIEEQAKQIVQMKARVDEKEAAAQRLEGQLLECRQTNEGTRQLINKLLQDISVYQKDIEWYKRTYQQRSLWGYIKERFSKKEL